MTENHSLSECKTERLKSAAQKWCVVCWQITLILFVKTYEWKSFCMFVTTVSGFSNISISLFTPLYCDLEVYVWSIVNCLHCHSYQLKVLCNWTTFTNFVENGPWFKNKLLNLSFKSHYLILKCYCVTV